MDSPDSNSNDLPAGFSLSWMPRFKAVREKLESLPSGPGWADICIFDRATNGIWSAGDVTRPGWTASTIKLAIAMDLLRYEGFTRLSGPELTDLEAMLHSSDNEATDRLWSEYGGEAMLERLSEESPNGVGMTSLAFQPGHSDTIYWRFLKCSTLDLIALGRYMLKESEEVHQKYLLKTMRGVSETQRWGVWAAGPENAPAVKNGWAQKPDDWGTQWLMRSMGFAGPQARYIVALNYQQPSPGSLEDGVQVVSDLVALLFGQPVPANVSIPPD